MQQTLFDLNEKTVDDISNPETYKGIFSFHKYWGKKPTESLAYFIQNYTDETDIVLDPFLGSGLISRECLLRNRRFIGVDINPFSIEHTKFILDLPNPSEYIQAFNEIEKSIKEKINSTYKTENGKIASHFLWKEGSLVSVWRRPETGRNRLEADPSDIDQNQINKYSDYEPRNIRKSTFFTNSRINSKAEMAITDLFTRRALYNIDLIIDEVEKYPDPIKRALYLTLTSSSGQMSSMVFAITGRGKTKNLVSEKIEVGSWVIGFWKPNLHFEINVWNCFESRATKLYKSLQDTLIKKYTVHDSIDSLLKVNNGAAIIHANCLLSLKEIPDKSIKLICTDPPHSDRIPYLELSELWNSILNKKVIFEDEIIVSNAKERNKKKPSYINDMTLFISESSRVLKDDGLFLLYYNARDKQSWKFMELLSSTSNLNYIGAFPMEYSANSVVQDNRKGGMKTDFVLVMVKNKSIIMENHELEKLPGWISYLPKIES
ncbi:methyltransferase domain protein [Leptospira wolbachii serovar Codice str. CDC]|uniref:Methyltransferase n=1 Tax=Leptospira wolbachii serovar Codice str. CDC TaxID=1218599 RepID=R9A3N5_9LEPT|nr:DNA methyltransferase [Leptospira wolbachii]EOQ96806.1 methyltransferase domain protein [Leptospira wolbachii serovar Codice str. CDC]